MQIKKKYLQILWIYISFILVFNQFLGLFIPKTLLRGVYIIGVLLILIMNVIKRDMIIRLNKIDCVIATYIIYMLVRFVIQSLSEEVSSATNISFLQTALPVFGYFIAKEISNDVADKIEKWYVIFAAISVCIGIIDSYYKILPRIGAFAGGLYSGVGDGVYVLRGYSLAGNALITGYISGLGALLLITNKRLFANNKLIRVGLEALLIVALLNTFSRGAILMFTVGVILYLGLSDVFKQTRIKRNIAIGVVFLFVSVMFVIVSHWDSIINSAVFGRIFKAGLNLNDSSNAMRVAFYVETFQAMKEFFVFGKGFGYAGTQAVNGGVAQAINTESYILSLVVFGGVISLTLFLIIIFTVLNKITKNEYENTKSYGIILMGMFAWSVIYILLDSDLIALFYWYCLGRFFAKEKNKEI